MTTELTQEILSHRPAIEGFVLRLTGDAGLAEELAQETMVRADRKAAGFRGDSALGSWLSSIALNLVRDHFRGRARRPELPADDAMLERLAGGGEDAETARMRAEMSRCIAEHLLMLPAAQCRAVALHDMAGLDHREVAAELGISVANSRVLLHRGRAALRDILERNCELALGRDAIPCDRLPKAKPPP